MRIGTAPPGLEKAPNRGFWAIRDIPTAFWLILAALATIVHRDLPEPRWLMIHLLFLGAVTNLVVKKSSAGVNDNWDGDVGLGTVTANNGNALA